MTVSERRWTLCANKRRGLEGAPMVLSGPRLDLYEQVEVVEPPSDVDCSRAIEVLNKAAAVYDAHDARDAEFDQLPTRGGDSLRRVVAFLQKEKNTA